jgi:5-formyltetrahydrofolate cyclo-ligase
MKKQLRISLLAKRSALDPVERQAHDEAILRHLTAMPEVQAAETILLYLDFRGEPSSDAMIRWGLAAGKRICAPKTIVAERRLIPIRITDADDLVIGAYDIREPRDAEGARMEAAEIDAVILPGVGFDRRGGRLGYGGGYYDRFLPQLREGVPKIAVAYEVQVLPEVPLEPHDMQLDALVTEAGVWRF